MDLGLSEIDMEARNDSCNHLGLLNELRHILPHPFPLPRSSIVDSAIINFVICVVFEIVSHGMCSNVDVSLIPDINLAVVNFALLVLSTHELFACFCTHQHPHKPSLFSFSSIFWTRQTISSFGVTYTCGFQSSSCSKRL